MRDSRRVESDDVVQRAGALRDQIYDYIEKIAKLIETLTKESESQKATLAKEQARLQLLEARLVLRELFPAIRDYVERAKWANKADLVLKRFQPITKSVTVAAKAASALLLNTDFEKLFTRECGA
ncbi:MAG: hypothetical protein V3T05_03125 [Myxococcota bacterium]